MPELPEVETYKKYLEGTSIGHKVLKIEIDDPKLVKPSVSEFQQKVMNQELISTDRIGKYLFINLSNGKVIVMHFGLTGKVEYFKDLEDIPKYTRVLFFFENDFKLSYICKRKFGWVEIADGVLEYKQRIKLGDDALVISYQNFYDKMHKKRTLLKPTLLDQKVTAGIGNWVASIVCGFFWEMWNFYSNPKWYYTIPGIDFWHIFEMPLIGYLGYIPFSLELFALYHLVVGIFADQKLNNYLRI